MVDNLTVYAKHYRGFKEITLNIEPVTFLVGDNSSGKTSILHLIDLIQNTELSLDLVISEDHYADQRDIFSPYFEGKAVTVAFYAVHGENVMAKVITANKDEKNYAEIESCTFLSEDFAVSTKLRRGKPFLRMEEQLEPVADVRRLLKINASPKGYAAVKSRVPVKRINATEGAYPLVLEAVGSESGDDDPAFQAINGKFSLPGAIFMGPLRAMPERYYKSLRRFDVSGSHFAAMWVAMSAEVRASVNSDLEQFGSESGLFDRIVVEQIDVDVFDPPLFIYVEKNGHKFTLDQVGIGVSQVVPILFQSAVFRAAKQRTLLLLQQPELHLHPRAQAALGSYIARCVADGVRFVIETHSDFLIDRFRSHMRDERVTDRAAVVFCQGSEGGNSAYSMKIEADGSIPTMTASYREFFRKEFTRTLF